MNILGMSYMYHDSAAVLLRDGEVVGAVAEERFTRVKHTVDFPIHAVAWCLERGGIRADDLDAIVFYEKPFLKFERILTSHLMMWPWSFGSFRHFLPMWLHYKLRVPQVIRERIGFHGPVEFVDHHYAHAASAFLPSPFERAMVLTADGTGEWSTLSLGIAEGTSIRLDQDIRFPHSLGLLYSAVTAHLGFKVNDGEGKVMGLASYGTPRYRKEFEQLLQVRDDGSFQLDMRYFAFHHDLTMTNRAFAELLFPPRPPESELRQEHMDLAASLQHAVEEALLAIVRYGHRKYGVDKLCLAGGVALNCVANGRIATETPIRDLWVQPAAGDDGGALGAALYAYTARHGGKVRWPMKHAFLGPSWDEPTIAAAARSAGVETETFEDDDALVARTAELLAEGRILAWFQGAMEYGPRALGGRSILADPRPHHMKDTLNRRVKRREGFRPFAPAVPAERCRDWFDTKHTSPFMLLTVKVRPECVDKIPAITHVDGTARLQTVTDDQNPLFYKLLHAFGARTGVPVLLNTSFNVRGEPIVNAPKDAVACFLGTDIDVLVLGRHVLRKPNLPPPETHA